MDDATVIYEYTLKQAIEDGVLVEVFKKSWDVLSGNKPIVATAALFAEVSQAGLIEIWNEFVHYAKERAKRRPRGASDGGESGEPIFKTRMNGKTVWVMEDGQAFTMMYPEDY